MATSVALVRGLQPEERQEVLEEDDEMPPPTEGDEETDAPMEAPEGPEPSSNKLDGRPSEE